MTSEYTETFDGWLECTSSVIPIYEIKKENYVVGTLFDDGTCCICLEDYSNNKAVKRFPCGHLFCSGCIDVWLENNNSSCPKCRKVFLHHIDMKPRESIPK